MRLESGVNYAKYPSSDVTPAHCSAGGVADDQYSGYTDVRIPLERPAVLSEAFGITLRWKN